MKMPLRPIRSFVLRIGLLCTVLPLAHGCSKPPESSGPPGVKVMLAIAGKDVNPDGTISEAALKRIEEQAGQPGLGVNFIRAPLSDKGLAQLKNFPNLRRIAAIGSPLTDKAIADFKKEIPQVEILK